MFKLSDLLSRFKKEENSIVSEQSTDTTGESDVQRARNWFEERYETLTVHRNILFALVFFILLFSIAAVGGIAYVINAKKFDPFVIQIDEDTGAARIVNPLVSKALTADESIAKYFIKKYVIARETYNPVDFETYARKIIRLLSSNNIYWGYRGYIKADTNNPLLKYGQKNTTFLTVKSWSKLSEDEFIMRFALTETAGRQQSYNKIAVIKFEFIAMELTEEERDINPIGFQVIGYRVDDDNS